ncbi:MAG: hypothetical protein KIT22_16380, partial [Verrucomicrobiae bacterium]|nr:hypothetical protein [Verrucomicrobiae bacterium]
MKLSQSRDRIADYTLAQLVALFPMGRAPSRQDFRGHVVAALDRVEYCFARIAHPRYSDDKGALFDPLNSDQYCQFLYFLSNSVHERGGSETLASRLFCLNKALHGFNCMYDTKLPAVFWVIHAVGTVLGKASYGSHFVVRQNCTVGALGGFDPQIGVRVVLSAGASIIGRCQIGRNVMLSPDCCLVNQEVPDDTLVTASSRLKTRPNSPRAFSIH